MDAPATLPGSITLARHGRPNADRTVRLASAGYRDWWAEYDRVELHPSEKPPQDIIDAARQADILIASSLPRARATARMAAPDREVTVDPAFVEAPLPPPPLPRFMQLKPPTWGVLSRVAWWMGYAAGGESRPAAETRAEAGADKLVQMTADGRSVMVFAHGWFNRMLRPALTRRGYVCVQDGGDAYWSFRVYEPRAVAFTHSPALDKVALKGDAHE